MHPATEHALIEQLCKDGLPRELMPTVRTLFRRIAEGHTALALNAEEQTHWQHSPWADHSTPSAPLAVTAHWLQTGRHRAQEARVARRLKARAVPVAGQLIEALKLMPMGDPSQLNAITGAGGRQLALVLGGPGSGKTTTAAAVLTAKIHQFSGPEPPTVALLAPTGKAAVRLTEAFQSAVSSMPDTLRPSVIPKATTIHRQLHQLREVDLILIDEASMVSLDLMDQLLNNLGPDTQLILMGDPHQLASVEAGSVLSTLAKTEVFAADRFTLTGRHRTDQGVGLHGIQDACLAGDLPAFLEALEDAKIQWIKPSDVGALEQCLAEGYAPYFDAIESGNTRTIPEFQCLTSISAGVGGRHWVNRLVTQQAMMRGLNGRGHRLLVTENQPTFDIYNGDIGVMLDPEGSEGPQIWISGSERTVILNQINQPETAYAISIHRSQGSEYAKVLVCLPEPSEQSHYRPTRELLYTALTRAKQGVTLFASEAQLAQALATPTQRMSCLEHFLQAD